MAHLGGYCPGVAHWLRAGIRIGVPVIHRPPGPVHDHWRDRHLERSHPSDCGRIRAVRAVSTHRADGPVVGARPGQEQRTVRVPGRVAQLSSTHKTSAANQAKSSASNTVSPLAQIDGLRWKYSIGDWVLRDIQLQLQAGERVGLVGRSGSGKSSLALTFNGIIPQSYAGQMAGQVVVAGNTAASTPVAELARCVAMVFQSPDDQMSQILVRHEVASGPANLGLPLADVLERTAESLAVLGIERLADRETASLSGGEKQKVALAAALAMRPRLLVLDEPTTDLDPRAKSDLVATLQALDAEMTMVIVSHDLETIAPLVDRLVIVDDGAIVADASADQLLRDPALLDEHGIAVPQLAALNAAFRRRDPDWISLTNVTDVAAALGARGVVPGPPSSEAPPRTDNAPVIRLNQVTF